MDTFSIATTSATMGRMPRVLRDRWVYDEAPIRWDKGDKITTPTGWYDSNDKCPDCDDYLVFMSGLLFCFNCYLLRQKAHVGKAQLGLIKLVLKQRQKLAKQRRKKKKEKGLTLIELMIVVAVIGILSAIIIPQMGQCIRASKEATTKGNLGTLRSAIAVYQGDNDGLLPTDLSALTVNGKYLGTIPNAFTVWHPTGNNVGNGDLSAFIGSSGDDYQWWYCNDQTSCGYLWGRVIVNCIHTDIHGRTWTLL